MTQYIKAFFKILLLALAFALLYIIIKTGVIKALFLGFLFLVTIILYGGEPI